MATMDYVTIKISAHTRMLLRMLAAFSGEQMASIVNRLCEEELERLNERAKQDGGPIILVRHTKKGELDVSDGD